MRRLTRILTVFISALLIAPTLTIITASAAHADPSADDWYRLRMCEASNRYDINTGNGYYGAYQFNVMTWESVGGLGYPHEATPDEQDYRALVLYRHRGWQPWPACTKKLNLVNDADARSKVSPPAPHGFYSAPSFRDVRPGNTHYRNIGWLESMEITKPADGLYKPGNDVTRGAMVAFLFRLVNPSEPAPICLEEPFYDVPVTNVFCGYIDWAKEQGITKGYPDESFRAAEPVTRGAMAAFLLRISGDASNGGCESEGPYPDVAATDEFCGAITWARDNGITYGISNGPGLGTRYGTTEPVSRQAMASFLYRIYEYMS